MDEKFEQFVAKRVKWDKFGCDVGYWLLAWYGAALTVYLFTSHYETCVYDDFDLFNATKYSDEFLIDGINRLCNMQTERISWAVTWIILSAVNILIHLNQNKYLSKHIGFLPVRKDGKDWTTVNAVSYVLIEWFPTLTGVAYILLFGPPIGLFENGVFNAFVVTAQIIWLAPLWFRFKGKNIAEILTGITLESTEKQRQKLEKTYKNKRKHAFNNFYNGTEHVAFIALFLVYSYGIVQYLRVPDIHPEYYGRLYGDYNPVWDNNRYFAFAGLNAPEDVEDFYSYGKKITAQRVHAFEIMKQRTGVPEDYLRAVPDFPELKDIKQGEPLILNESGWKNLKCLYDLNAVKDDQCATFADLESYIAQNKTLWQRYNQLPKIDSVYMAPQQLLGSSKSTFADLAKLKAAHIIYLAKHGESEKAMKEWLSYMKLYREIAVTKETMVTKAAIAVTIKVHFSALEVLLSYAPKLAIDNKDELLTTLKKDQPIFNEKRMLSHDWGLMEPSYMGLFGNKNALFNDLVECYKTFESLAQLPIDQFPYTENITLCPLDEERSTFETAFVYPMLTPGNYKVNVIYSMLIAGVLKGEALLGGMKITQVMFKQAQLAILLLADGVKPANVNQYIKNLGEEYYDPFTNKPFAWGAERQVLSFEHPIGKRLVTFKVNLSE